MLNKHFAVIGSSNFFYKPVGKDKTSITESEAKESFKTLLRTKNHAFIYHCHNHYCCPIGYESEPMEPSENFIFILLFYFYLFLVFRFIVCIESKRIY